jgi:CubicO group peptidase (beta-lactamase class C family)
MRMLLMLCIGLAAVAAPPAIARPSSDTAVAREAEKLLAESVTESGPGAVVLIASGDRLLYRGARGAANIELGVRLTPDSSLRIASITKIFTAALIVKLSEKGALSLDDPLSRFLPDFPGADGVTIRQLLSHTAGISDKIAPEDRQPGFSRRDNDMATLVAEIAKRARSFAPGSDQSYSNAGYILLGAVIEKVTGKAWHVALHDELLAPAGLSHTRYAIASSIIPGRAAGYTGAPGQIENAPFISMTAPASAGALASTADDLRIWMRALAGGRIVSAAGFQAMATPAVIPGKTPPNPYGFGLYTWPVRGETMVGHTGQIDGFASFLGYIPARDLVIVALANNDRFDARTFGQRLAAIALRDPYPAVVPVAIGAADLAALAGRYADGIENRTIMVQDGKLYQQRGSGPIIPLQLTRDGRLHFLPDELSYFTPVRDDKGVVTALAYVRRGEGPAIVMPRIP